jgi:hypothetical protein
LVAKATATAMTGFGVLTSVGGSKLRWWIDPMGAIILSVLVSALWPDLRDLVTQGPAVQEKDKFGGKGDGDGNDSREVERLTGSVF